MRISDIIKGSDKDKKTEDFSFRHLKETLEEREESNAANTKDREKSFLVYDKTVSLLRSAMRDVYRGKKPLSLDSLGEAVGFFVKNTGHESGLLLKVFYGGQSDIFAHSVNVAILAIKVGNGLEYSADRLMTLGLGGLFHDTGMLKISKIVAKRERVKGNEKELIRRHPKIGYEILRALGDDFGRFARIALQEHEREDGSGYPQGLMGEEIDEMAKIIGAVDVYEALIHPRPHRPKLFPFDAVKTVVEKEKEAYSPKILKALINELSAFPVGTYVRLNSGFIGRVLEVNSLRPLRPKVVLLYNVKGERLLEKKVVDLCKTPLLYVKKAVSEKI